MHTNIEFRDANVTALAVDTCIADASIAEKLCECGPILTGHCATNQKQHVPLPKAHLSDFDPVRISHRQHRKDKYC